MSQVLYRKYRSKDFSEVYGQDSIIKVIRQALKDDKLAHAYLFTGPRGTGKTTMARLIAKALNCQNPKGIEPCNKCNACKSVNEGNFLDLVEIDAASNRGIDEIRDLKEKVGFLPVEGSYKIYIIDEVHMLTLEAFNALLKTLEEPPEKVVFVLATTEVHKIPQTIISRTQRFDFRLGAKTDLVNKLGYILKQEGIKFEENALELVAEAGNGSFRDSETILEKIISSSGYQKDKIINKSDVESILGYADSELINNLFQHIASGETKQAFEVLKIAEEQGINFVQLVKQLLEMGRSVLIDIVKNNDKTYSMKFLSVFVREFNNAANELNYALVPILPIEVAIVNIIREFDKEEQPMVKQKIKKKLSKEKSQAKKSEEEEEEEEKEENKTMVESLKTEEVRKEPAQAEVKKIAEKVAKIDKEKAGDLSISMIKQEWPQFIEMAKKNNPYLATFFSNINIIELKEENLIIEVPFAFHKKRIESSKVRKVINQMSEELYGHGFVISCSINKELVKEEQKSTASNEDLVEEVFADLL